MGPFCPCRACNPWKSWHPEILPGGVLGGGQASRSGVKRPVTGDPDGAQPGPEPPSSQSPTQVNQGATRPLWTLRVATKTCRAWPGPLLVLWRPESSFPNSDQCRGQVLTPQFMGKLQDKVVTAESGGEGSGLGGGGSAHPASARHGSPGQNNCKAHSTGEKGPARLSGRMTPRLQEEETARGPWGSGDVAGPAGQAGCGRGGPCSGPWGLIGTLWVVLSPLVSREGIRDSAFQAAWGLCQVSTGPGPPPGPHSHAGPA